MNNYLFYLSMHKFCGCICDFVVAVII